MQLCLAGLENILTEIVVDWALCFLTIYFGKGTEFHLYCMSFNMKRFVYHYTYTDGREACCLFKNKIIELS